MKRNKLLAVLVFLSATCLFGCGKEKEEGTASAAPKDYVYKMEDIDFGRERDVNQILRSGDSFYAYDFAWSDGETDAQLSFYELNGDGKVGKTYDIPVEETVSVRNVYLDDDANIYCIKNDFHAVNGGNGGDVPEVNTPAMEPREAENIAQEEEGEIEDVEEAGGGSQGAEARDGVIEGREAAAVEDEDETGNRTEEGDEAPSGDIAAENIETDDMALDDIGWDENEGDIEYIDDYYLVKMSLTGEEFFKVKLNDIPEFQQLEEENGYFYIGDMILDKTKGIYINSYGVFFKFDLDGNFEGKVSGGDGENSLEGTELIALDDGRMVAIIYEENGGISIAVADLEKGTIGEKNPLPGVSYAYSLYAGTGYDLYLTDTYGVYGYNLGDTDKTQLLSYIDSDLDFTRIYQIMGIDDKTFWGIHDDQDTGYSMLARFTKVPPEEVKDRKEIVLAMAYSNWNIRRMAIAFNKANEEYKISIMDYASLYGSDMDYMAGINKLNTDIASGKVPDILLINYEMPVDSYISKGLFEDLKPYIEKDSGLDINNFMPNIIEAFSVKGKLCTLVPSYSIQTVLAKASDVGEKQGWTVQEAMDLVASRPEGTRLFEYYTTRSSMLYNCMSMSSSQFIDWENGTCNFNSDSFVQMLDFIASFPETVDDSQLEDDYWNNYDSMWREGKVIAYMYSLGTFREYNRFEKGQFGEKITMVGFPAFGSSGTVISPDLQLAMSAKSKVKEGAWDFLRTFLTEEYQKEEVTYSFPVSIKRLDELAQEAREKPYYIEDDNSKVEYDDTYYIGGQEIIIPPMTKEETDAFKEKLYSFTEVYKVDDALLNIISEEAAPYFAGQKRAEDVAKIIQSRVQLYVNENR